MSNSFYLEVFHYSFTMSFCSCVADTFSPRAQKRSFLFTRLSFLLSNCLGDSFDVAPFEYIHPSFVVSCSVLPFRVSLVRDSEYFTILLRHVPGGHGPRVAFVVSE